MEDADGSAAGSPTGLAVPRVLVVGAGIVGLTVATVLRESKPLRHMPLTVWAKEFPPNTTSNVGAALLGLALVLLAFLPHPS